jgi:hypothetical protein
MGSGEPLRVFLLLDWWRDGLLFQPVGLLMEIGGMGSQCQNRLLVGDPTRYAQGSLGLPT